MALKVLVVDDDFINRKLITDSFKKESKSNRNHRSRKWF